MAEQITVKRLENRVRWLNDLLGRPQTQYTRLKSGKLKANGGNYHLDGAYGGYALYMMVESGGATDVSRFGHQSKRRLDEFLSGMLEGVETAQRNAAKFQRVRKKNPVKKRAAKKVMRNPRQKQQHWIVQVEQLANNRIDQTAYYDGTMAGAKRYFKGLPAINKYWGKTGYRITLQPNAIVLWDGWTSEYGYNPVKKNPGSPYDGKGAHLVFLFNKNKLCYVGKVGKNHTLETVIGKAHKFKTLGGASDIAQRIQMPTWAKNVGVMKASNPAKFAKNIQKTTYGGKA